MVGYGFMGATHSHAWRTAHRFFELPLTPVLATLAGRTEATLVAAAERFGFERTTTRWQDLVEDPEIDVIDICTPGDTHYEIAMAALAAGKHVLCEKPLANSVKESEQMTAAAAEARKRSPRSARSMCGFSYRRTPALAYARQLVAEGAVGEIRQVRAQYLQDWLSDADAPMTWRLDRDKAGSGALGDIGAHIVDLTQWITGQQIASVSGTLQTVVPTRPSAGTAQGLGGTGDASGERRDVTVDDLALFTARFETGVLGSFEATRMAQGRKNAMRVEINGSAGSIAFDFERMNELEVYDATAPAGRQGFTRILTTEPEHPYAAHWWPTGHGLGYEHTFTHQIADLVTAIGEGTDPSPSFEEALHVQRVLAAVEASAADGSSWTSTDPETTQESTR
ncbi:MAG: Gfo/Idh/MocA family oxidoreductase [Brachybacterium sp.]|nr:Gfo/Idh/MocA family oxidoreductase [Brachybacterium sp.]